MFALQEVGSPEALTDLLGLVGGSWHTRVADGDGRGIRVAVASRFPVTAHEQVVALPAGMRPVQGRDERFDDPAIMGVDESLVAGMKRPALHVEVDTPSGVRVVVVTAHLKSKLVSYPSDPVPATVLEVGPGG